MAVRQILYTVTANGISPTVKQSAGVQGDHRATEVRFNIEPLLYEKITLDAKTFGGKLIYRFDGFDGVGGVINSDVQYLTKQEVSYFLEEPLTRYGGLVRVVLVISVSLGASTEMELYSFPALLQLENSPNSISSENYQSISTLAQVAKDASQTAVEAKEVAVEAQGKTEAARAALEGGAEYIFDGGDATSEIDIEFVADNQMSDTSENPVKNKVIKKYVDDIGERDHSVGSVWIGSNPNLDPKTLFGGEWELFDKEFKASTTDEKMNDVVHGGEVRTSNVEIISVRSGHSIRFRLKFTPAITENKNLKLFTLNFGNHGLQAITAPDGEINYFPYNILNFIGMTEDGITEVFTLYNGASENEGLYIRSKVTAGTTYCAEVIVVALPSQMQDSFCNKFYWRRMA